MFPVYHDKAAPWPLFEFHGKKLPLMEKNVQRASSWQLDHGKEPPSDWSDFRLETPIDAAFELWDNLKE
jgi:hypothetical protein